VSHLWTTTDQISIQRHQHSIRLWRSNKVCHGTRTNELCGICEYLLSRIRTGFLFKCTNILQRLRRSNKVNDQPPPSPPVRCEKCVAVCCNAFQCVAMRCSVLQCVAVSCSVLQCVVVCCSLLQCVAVCCSVLQCVAVCYLPRLLKGVTWLTQICYITRTHTHTHTHTHAHTLTRTRVHEHASVGNEPSKPGSFMQKTWHVIEPTNRCSVLHCVAVCGSVLQCIEPTNRCYSITAKCNTCVVVCCSVLQCSEPTNRCRSITAKCNIRV